MRNLYPPLEPFHTEFLQVSERHRLYIEESGNPEGKPIVLLHGGPGGGTMPLYRQFFNPRQWRIVLFDQRGCGKSIPHADLTDNTTWDLVDDIEKIRQHLGIEQWTIFGGSWGSTLALAYSETYPQRCSGLILRGIFTLRQKEIHWFYQDGANYLYPDAWEAYLAPIPVEQRGDLVKAYYQQLTSEDAQTRQTAARAWAVWEASTSKLLQDPGLMNRFSEDEFAEAFARIECHYFVNRGFFEPDDQLLRQVGKIRHIPGVIIQGRYDVVCPPVTAWELHRAWPEAKFVMVQEAGHSATEPGIISALVEATDEFATF